MRRATSALATLVGMKTIVKRPYKVNIEVRQSADGFAVTIVSRSTRAVSLVSSVLKKYGYKYAVYFDSYGFIRLHVRGLTYDEVAFIEKAVYDGISKKTRTSADDFLLVSS